jgi:hypothetical protein
MEEYRAVHHAKYLERERIRERSKKVHELIDGINTCKTIFEVRKVTKKLLEILEEPVEELDFGLKLVEAISACPLVKVQLDKKSHTQASRTIQGNVKKILSLCGLDDTIEIQYEMDCSRDEEIARSLI